MGRIPTIALALFTAMYAVWVGCAGSSRTGPPPAGEIFWPTGLQVDPASGSLVIVSSNFDWNYSGGSVTLADPDSLQLLPAATVAIGSFAGAPLLVPDPADGVTHGYVATRDDGSIVWFTLRDASNPKSARIDCGSVSVNGVSRCGADHVVKVLSENGEPASAPYGVGLVKDQDGTHSFLVVAAVGDGTLAVFSLSSGYQPRQVAAVTLAHGLHSVAEGPVGPLGRKVYVSNRLSNIVHTVLFRARHGDVEMTPSGGFALQQVTQSGDYYRGMAVSPDGKQLYVATRSPAGLLVVRTATFQEPDEVLGLVPLAGQPSEVLVARAGVSHLVYVSDYGLARVYCVDPSRMEVVDIIDVHRGPYAMALAHDPHGVARRLYVASFEESLVDMIDVDQDSTTFHTVIGELK